MSKIEVNTVEPQCGTTLTLGACGQTVALGSGASQTGFGRTGTVDWITTPKVTGDSPVTGVTGKGYFLNTTAGTITLNLPAGAAGSIVSMADYAATWQTNNVTVAPNGAEKIGGLAQNAVLSTEGQSVTFVYVDSTQGWINTMDSTSNVRGTPPYMVATGGTPCAGATCGDYKIHTFTGPGTFCVSNAGTPSGSNSVEYLVVAGGGGGGRNNVGGGGGAGGFRFASPSIAPLTYPAKPLAGPANLPVSVQGYPIAVGGGGTFGVNTPTGANGTPGVDSSFSSITSTGGGGGGGEPSPTSGTSSPVSGTGSGSTSAGFASGLPGGSGGGARGTQSTPGSPNPANNYYNPGGVPLVQNGNVPVVSPLQGNPGGGGYDAVTANSNGGGGGGAMCKGNSARGPGNGTDTGGPGGAGGGLPTAFGSNGQPCGSFRYYAGGGGGGQDSTPGSNPTGGVGGGGNGSANPGCATAGGCNTGGGGGNTSGGGCSAAGGSGIVVIRYKFQN